MRDGSATRQKIHQAALTLFATRGVAETSVRDLAQAAGVAEGTLYRHYASKDDLVADLFATNYAAFAARLAALRDLDGVRARLAAVAAEIFRFHDTEPALFRFLLLQPATALVYGRLSGPLSPYAETVAAACWRALNP